MNPEQINLLVISHVGLFDVYDSPLKSVKVVEEVDGHLPIYDSHVVIDVSESRNRHYVEAIKNVANEKDYVFETPGYVDQVNKIIADLSGAKYIANYYYGPAHEALHSQGLVESVKRGSEYISRKFIADYPHIDESQITTMTVKGRITVGYGGFPFGVIHELD